jgi:hypothetical protein
MSFSQHHRALNVEQLNSLADQPQAIATAWARRGIRTLTVGPPVRSRSASRAPRRHSRLHFCLCLSLLLSPSQSGETRQRRHHELTALVSYHHGASAQNPTAQSFAATPSTSSSHPLSFSTASEATFTESTAATVCGTSPEFKAVVVEVARVLPILAFLLL